jgi:HD superfamily phosphohydrolase
MSKIFKLTPATIKRMIAEEKQKLVQEAKEKEAKEKRKLLEQLRFLKKLKNRQKKSLKEAKEIHSMKKAIAKKIKSKRRK